MPLRPTVERDKTPLLANSKSSDGINNAAVAGTAADPPAARTRPTGGGGIRRLLFSSSAARSDPPGEKGQLPHNNRQRQSTTVDTRTIVKKQDPVEEKTSNNNRSPPRPLEESSRDSQHKRKRLLSSTTSTASAPANHLVSSLKTVDPPAYNAAPSPTKTKGNNNNTAAAARSEKKSHFSQSILDQNEISAFATFPEMSVNNIHALGTTGIDNKMGHQTNGKQHFQQQQQQQQHRRHPQPQHEEGQRRHPQPHQEEEDKEQPLRVVRSSYSTEENSTGTAEDSIGTSTYQVLFARNQSHDPAVVVTTNNHDEHHHHSELRTKPAAKQNGGSSSSSSSRGLLARPFGRASLPPEIARKWVVDLSSAEWDADEKRWKYRILIQRRMVINPKNNSNNKSTTIPKRSSDHNNDGDSSSSTGSIKSASGGNVRPQQSFTNAFTWRSLADFLWLEKALRREYHGGLLVPDLSIALGRPLHDDANLEETPVEAEPLRNWLSDVLNGVRGQGELLLDHNDKVVNLLRSESMEAFLYRNAGVALHEIEGERSWMMGSMGAKRASLPKRSNLEYESEPSLFRALNDMLLSPLELCVGPQACGGHCGGGSTTSAENSSRLRQNLANRGFPVIACQSRALSTAPSLDVEDSIAETANISPPRVSVGTALHSELLEAEKELVLHYRKTSLVAMEKLQHLQRDEEKLGAAWQRFAISLSNLFAFEKDVENIRLGDSKIKRENMPFRKVAKTTVDDFLRVLSRQKVNRALPALDALSDMLGAYVADLSAVEPSVAVYLEAVNQFTMELVPSETFSSQPDERNLSRSWDAKFKALALATRKQAARSFGSSGTDPSTEECEAEGKCPRRSDDRTRLLHNEKLLRQSLTTMCRATPIRVCRMAWKYLNTEASHCALIHSAAVTLRKNTDVANRSSVSKMLNRHHQEEKDDDDTELSLVERLIQFGMSSNMGSRRNEQSTPEYYSESIDDRAKARLKEKVLQILRTRRGRWDASLAAAILEAAGVEDTDVKVDETTRELRMVRKYAVGLRESLTRCEEALKLLQGTVGQNDGTLRQNRLSLARNSFFVEMSKVFSGTIESNQSGDKSKSSTLATSVLTKAGIDTSDPFGWTPSTSAPRTTFTQGRLGDLAHAYFLARDARIEWLLRSLSDLLRDYSEKIEIVEGFVYMECVGIQIEKCFSQRRSKALSAFEKKADLTAAVNVATKKRIKKLVKELQAKLDEMGPGVSQTQVKESKDAHLESKEIKGLLHELGMRRLSRVRETSTERVIAIIDLWAKEEELSSARELKALGETMNALERSIGKEDFDSLVYRYSKRTTVTEEGLPKQLA